MAGYMPQLDINQGPQDVLLFDGSQSQFTHDGYLRTSNHEIQLIDVDAGGKPELGTTARFIIPRNGDMVGPVDLLVKFNQPTTDGGSAQHAAWVESMGYAMIDHIVFSIGSNEIETVTGEQLHIMNELMRTDEKRYTSIIGKSGRPIFPFSWTTEAGATSASPPVTTRTLRTVYKEVKHGTRKVLHATGTSGNMDDMGTSLIVPLDLLFTSNPSRYLPLAAIASNSDVTVSVKFRNVEELMMLSGELINEVSTASADIATPVRLIQRASHAAVSMPVFANGYIASCKLRCHFVHLTGPEVNSLKDVEQTRLYRPWQRQTQLATIKCGDKTAFSIPIELGFLHPVQEIIVVVRKVSDMSSSSVSGGIRLDADDHGAIVKNRFAFHGAGDDPNIDSLYNAMNPRNETVAQHLVKVNNVRLVLNGQDRHPGLTNRGLDPKYMNDHIIRQLHSNTSASYNEQCGWGNSTNDADLKSMCQYQGRRSIFVFPFSLNPEGHNPSGAVNFSKVSHAKLFVEGTADYLLGGTVQTASMKEIPFQIDVFGVGVNWLQIKDGRAIKAFT